MIKILSTANMLDLDIEHVHRHANVARMNPTASMDIVRLSKEHHNGAPDYSVIFTCEFGDTHDDLYRAVIDYLNE